MTVPSLGDHCKQANSAIFCSHLWPSGEIKDSLKVKAVIFFINFGFLSPKRVLFWREKASVMCWLSAFVAT